MRRHAGGVIVRGSEAGRGSLTVPDREGWSVVTMGASQAAVTPMRVSVSCTDALLAIWGYVCLCEQVLWSTTQTAFTISEPETERRR